MPYPRFDRDKVKMLPLSERENKQRIEDKKILPDSSWSLDANGEKLVDATVKRIIKAKENSAPVMLTFGAHSIKNCLSPVFIELMKDGWVSHLATNGAGVIHDWEFSYQGETSEDVQKYASQGQFGNWEETGYNINLAIIAGAYKDMGYGESVGSFIANEGVEIPCRTQLENEIKTFASSDPSKAAAAADFLYTIKKFDIPEGKYEVKHPYKHLGVQSTAYDLGIPFTSHPMIGHDIIYNHAMNSCSAIGRAAERDFLTFAESVSRLDKGVYMSVGSAVMSPMVFEKSMSITRNVAIQNGQQIDNHFILIVDLQKSHWDWTQGEPPESNPDYYLRYNKSFSRMGGEMAYLSADNRDFLLALCQKLKKLS
ncbi:MAG: hypothetical protein NE328_24505 [Lentisphaeraceae bacterium]|nr:hypothetical protein [Lentisphaeraceae bacterium]